jgi:hypothetical protein
MGQCLRIRLEKCSILHVHVAAGIAEAWWHLGNGWCRSTETRLRVPVLPQAAESTWLTRNPQDLRSHQPVAFLLGGWAGKWWSATEARSLRVPQARVVIARLVLLAFQASVTVFSKFSACAVLLVRQSNQVFYINNIYISMPHYKPGNVTEPSPNKERLSAHS